MNESFFYYIANDSATINLRSASWRTLVRSVILFSILASALLCGAQSNTDNAYRKPLKEVLTDIQKKYGVTIRYTDNW